MYDYLSSDLVVTGHFYLKIAYATTLSVHFSLPINYFLLFFNFKPFINVVTYISNNIQLLNCSKK